MRNSFNNWEEPCCKVTMKDACRVIQGICQANSKCIKTCEDMVKLCIHENMRVYHDRLCCVENRKMLINQI